MLLFPLELFPSRLCSLSSLPSLVSNVLLLSAFEISETTSLHFLTLLISLYHFFELHTYYLRYPGETPINCFVHRLLRYSQRLYPFHKTICSEDISPIPLPHFSRSPGDLEPQSSPDPYFFLVFSLLTIFFDLISLTPLLVSSLVSSLFASLGRQTAATSERFRASRGPFAAVNILKHFFSPKVPSGRLGYISRTY